MRIELKSERTVETYRQSLNSFRKYLSEQYSKGVDAITIDFVSDKVIREYIGWVSNHSSVGTRNVHLAALKAYVKYAASKNIDLTSLQISLAGLKHKKVYPKRHNWLSKDQILLILEQPKPTKIGVRDRFIILFLFSTGARLNEMITVKANDVITDGKHPYVRLFGKGDKPRIVPVPDDAFLENFRYYCELFHADGNLDTHSRPLTAGNRQAPWPCGYLAVEAMNNMLGDQPARKWDSLSEDDKLKFLGLK
ncbi:Tyrosine recombinase XerD [Caprobacter fermentans]|uniref:Tyrosine recombinase XerD n=2 Tax=Caproicibacter fermentans TaxID=2576756 RepID=A0A6N8HY11_9FIRM|nr:Tyrosine recombinase XerD [Caproicibacter fermentans]